MYQKQNLVTINFLCCISSYILIVPGQGNYCIQSSLAGQLDTGSLTTDRPHTADNVVGIIPFSQRHSVELSSACSKPRNHNSLWETSPVNTLDPCKDFCPQLPPHPCPELLPSALWSKHAPDSSAFQSSLSSPSLPLSLFPSCC